MAARPLVASRLSSLRDSAGAALRGRVELNLYFGEARIEGYNISSAALADDASVYIATLAVQQLVPALFNGAYAIGAAVLLGPLLFQILTG